MIALVMGGLFVAVAWWVVKQYGWGRVAAAEGKALGPWPFDPTRVATPGELVQAFDYLSLLRCGMDARAWNHRAVEAHLGAVAVAPPATVHRLADLYERARYAQHTADGRRTRGSGAALRGPDRVTRE